MSRKLVECVPNYSEGRRADVINKIADCFRGKEKVWLLDVSSDRDHNRMVVTAIGDPEAMFNAVFESVKIASELINMEEHKGGHPRIGATDVIPFVPLKGITMEECIELARKLGKKIADELGIPVYLYEEAALRPERKRLEVIRKGEYEGLKEEISKPERHPDYGLPKLHPTAGATVVGARKPLIAFNVNLGTNDINIAKKIAQFVRASSGGLGFVKAIGVELKEKGLVQVSMNLTDYTKNAVYRVYELVKIEAERWGVPVVESEIIGLLPAEALFDSISYYLKLHNFDPMKQVIEMRLLELEE
ncbi:MAG: glutamate formimidoyltransferase [Synergistetes bacterium]|nr:glutamate formimidoyltransferase [Synergistota bacterium]MCX8127231.1 glutamate formimidoyltransferase [Synergistota bacterium]MDW8191883.1 glutamate formimidoyltransferase [Synergistota bacterium]